MNTAYIRFCVSLFGAITMAMLAGAAIASNEGAFILWLIAGLSRKVRPSAYSTVV